MYHTTSSKRIFWR